MRPKRYPYVKKAKKQRTPKLIHEVEFVGGDVVVDGVLFENADFNVSRSYESVEVSLEFLAEIKASGNAD